MTTTDTLSATLGALATKTNPQAEVKNSTSAERALALATGYTITTPEEYQFAADDVRKIMDMSSSMDAERQVFTAPLNGVLSAFNSRFMPHIKTLDKAAALLKQKMGAFTQEQERLRAEERARAEAVARAERERLEAEAAAARKKADDEARAAEQAEAKRRAEAAAAQKKLDDEAASARTAKARKEAAERAEAQRIEDERIAAEQQVASEQRRLEAERRAQILETTAAMVVAQPSAAVAVPQAQGISTRPLIDYERRTNGDQG